MFGRWNDTDCDLMFFAEETHASHEHPTTTAYEHITNVLEGDLDCDTIEDLVAEFFR
jgi:hypothetical protein